MTEQQKRSLFFNATGKVATINYFEYFIFCKGMDVEREACAKLMEDMDARDNLSNYYKVAANKIRARGNNEQS